MNKFSRKKQIVKTAASLFREKGYNAVSMRDLAQALDIKAASLYNHIKSKQEILALIILEVAQDFTEHIHLTQSKNSSAIVKLEEIIQNHIQITIEKTNALACLNNDWMHLRETDLEKYLQMRNAYENQLRKIIEKGIELNEIENRNVDLILFSLLSTLRTFHLWYYKNKTEDSSAIVEEIKQNLLFGIVK